MGRKKAENTTKKIRMDTTSGSLAYNRLDMQVSQTLHMAVELYDNLNYLLVLDHYDDISLFDLDTDPFVVSYYQMKTNEQVVKIDTAIREGWIAKLNKQLERPEWLVKELGLITNCSFDISYSYKNEKGETRRHKDLLDAARTPFENFNEHTLQKIKRDIAERTGVDIEKVDLSKFAHMRTTLTIGNHRDLVEKEMSDFLYEKYPKIKVDTVKTIFYSMMDLLAKKQSNERLPEGASFDEVRRYKGFEKEDFSRVIDHAILISIPEIQELLRFINRPDIDMAKISLSYVTIMTDSNNVSNNSFEKLFENALTVIHNNIILDDENPWEYGIRISKILHKKEKRLCIPYSDEYIAVLVSCILINEARKIL